MIAAKINLFFPSDVLADLWRNPRRRSCKFIATVMRDATQKNMNAIIWNVDQ